MACASRHAGFERVIGFDMGGTSTDVSHYAGEYEREFRNAGRRRAHARADDEHPHGGRRGGSILHFDGARLRVGPDSAGANPGPACYRRGGPLAVTDANVMLGRVQPEFFPHVFGPRGDEPLDRDVVVARFTELARRIEAATVGPDAGAGRRGVCRDRGRQHGRSHQADFGAAWPRRDALHAHRVRRRRRAARLRRGGRPGD